MHVQVHITRMYPTGKERKHAANYFRAKPRALNCLQVTVHVAATIRQTLVLLRTAIVCAAHLLWARLPILVKSPLRTMATVANPATATNNARPSSSGTLLARRSRRLLVVIVASLGAPWPWLVDNLKSNDVDKNLQDNLDHHTAGARRHQTRIKLEATPCATTAPWPTTRAAQAARHQGRAIRTTSWKHGPKHTPCDCQTCIRPNTRENPMVTKHRCSPSSHLPNL